ncbi:hypothetical protein [Nostoc sp.]|uniref:hypothetical protein n=1 Tax=Nostoc sp. TaxID=1180 RepID=UPI002FF8449A
MTITVSASNQKITDTTKSSLRQFISQKSTMLQLIYKAFQVSGFFSSFKSNNLKRLTPNYGTMPTRSKN